jgi:hypothetical protein
MPRIRIDFTGRAGQSKYAEFDTNRSVDNVLEDIGRVASTGGLYTVKDGDRFVCTILGRRIEEVSVVRV